MGLKIEIDKNVKLRGIAFMQRNKMSYFVNENTCMLKS